MCCFINNGRIFSLKKEGNSAIYNNMDELKGHYAKWYKLTEKHKIQKKKKCWTHKIRN